MKNTYTAIIATGIITLSSVPVFAQSPFYPESYVRYRLVSYSTSTDGDAKCIQLTPGDAAEHPGELWSAPLLDKNDEEIDYQYFTFEQNPENPDEFAMICVGAPGGFVDPTPTQYDADGRWEYIFAEDITEDSPGKYGFVFKSTKARSASADGIPYYAIATDSKMDKADWLMNYGGSDEDYAIDISMGLDSENPDNSLFKFEEKKDIITQLVVADDVINSPLSSEQQKVYNLQGMFVQSPKNGLYISNGKVILIKQ